jgi:hypothetical protein
MKRRIVRILLLLVAGAIVNVAVAWAAPYLLSKRHPIAWNRGAATTYGWILKPQRGWPLSALSMERQRPERWYASRDVELPVVPLWPGFAINALFYAVILWLLFAAPFALRRRRRIKRGLCLACAYPIGESEVCTECGRPHTVKPKEMAA